MNRNDKGSMNCSENQMDFDSSDTETQPPDDPQSPGGEVEKQNYDQDELRNVIGAVEVDNIEYCNEFETQVLDADEDIPVTENGYQTQVVADEIPVMDIGDEPQVVADQIPVMDIGNETQVVADEIPVMDIENETQVVADEIPVMDIGNETQVVADQIPVMDIGNETQVVADEDIPVMDIGNETQVFGDGILDANLFNETQLLDLAGETQRVEELDYETYILTQVLDDNDVAIASDGDDSDKTEVLYDTEEASDDYSMKSGDMHTANDVGKASHKEDEASSDGGHQLGWSPCDFTTIRVASTIASGLAAQRRALERANGKSHSAASDRSSMRQLSSGHTCIEDARSSPNAVKKVSWVTDQEGKNEQIKELTHESRFNICSSTVRKLFADYTTAEIMQSDGGMNESNNGDTPEFGNGMAGLSYVNSQEPGELSQANALEFVDNLLKFNISENDKDVEIRKTNLGNHKAIPSAEGTRRLAKTAVPGTPFVKKAIFDWDDNHEDEGGGEFFRKKKDLFFDNGISKSKSLTQPKRPRDLDSRECKVMETCRGERADNFGINKNSKKLPKSDSKIGLRKIKGSENSSKLVESLNKDLNRHFSSSDDKLLDTSTRDNDACLLNVGPDTQIAAEAMETLGIAMVGNDFRVFKKTPKEMPKDCQDIGACNTLHIEQRDQLFPGDARVVRRQSRRTKGSVVLSRKDTSSRCENVKFSSERTRAKSSKTRRMVSDKCLSEDDGGNLNNVCSAITDQVKEKRISKENVDGTNICHITDSAVAIEKRECELQEHCGSLTPIARRTRQQRTVNQINPDGKGLVRSSKEIKELAGVASRKRSRRDANPFLAPVEARDGKSACDEQFDPRSSGTCDLIRSAAVEHPRGRRTGKKVQLSTGKCGTGYNTRSSRLKSGATSAVTGVSNVSRTDNDRVVKVASDGAETSVRVDSSIRNGCNPSSSACTTPTNCKTPVNDASPICIGDEYHKQSCRKRLSRSPCVKELNSLIMSGAKSMIPDVRRRRDMTDVRVLFSHHLDADIIKAQKKVLLRLGASDVSSMYDATHFITDQFVRTRNMLEAIALGKPVVTHLWLQSCGQASCLIDEKNFIMRDARKEKEIGFSMPVSLSKACQHPLLQGQKVLITPNTKPGKEILASLVKAVHGLEIERRGRSALTNEKLPDDLLILSCEEDYEICIPFLEKGAAVYSSELLLNGIVIQKLEYGRHRIFAIL